MSEVIEKIDKIKEDSNIEKEFGAKSSSVVLKKVVKQFPGHDGGEGVIAVNNFDLTINPGELTTLLGPSGCGKTTVLRMIAGFEVPTTGEIFLGNDNVVSVPPNKRDIAMVFQSYALFPHLTIYENIAYGLKLQKLSKSQIKEKADKVVTLMRLEEMKNRFPSQVSGGQQQRVALARAVVIEPKVLLFDEPLSNLDAKLREYMRDELRKLQQRLGITSLYVTHDQSEAMAISDKVVIMNNGFLEQIGSPREIYEYPNSAFVANFIGKSNFLPATYLGQDGDEATVKLKDSVLKIPNPGKINFKKDEEVLMAVRPESIHLTSEAGTLKGDVIKAIYFGANMEYEVECLGEVLFVEEYNPQITGMFSVGDHVGVKLDLSSIRLLPKA